MLFCLSIYIKKVVKLLAFTFEYPSYLGMVLRWLIIRPYVFGVLCHKQSTVVMFVTGTFEVCHECVTSLKLQRM